MFQSRSTVRHRLSDACGFQFAFCLRLTEPMNHALHTLLVLRNVSRNLYRGLSRYLAPGAYSVWIDTKE